MFHDFPAFAAEQTEPSEGFGSSVPFPRNVVLFHQGAAATEVYYLGHGLVKLARLQQSGVETIVGLRSAGWFLGASAAIVDEPHPVTAVTLTVCELARLDSARFRALVQADAALSWRLHRLHSHEIDGDLTRVADDRALTARERLELVLRRIGRQVRSEEVGAATRIALPLRHWELANCVGITPQYLCELLAQMVEEGSLLRDGDVLVLPKPCALASRP